MDQQALEQARVAVARARRSLHEIGQATEAHQVEEAWADFLNAMSRFYEKLKAGARGDKKSWSWYLKKADFRKVDPLLAYLLHARNCDHHRLEDVLAPIPGFSAISAVGSVHIKHLSFGPQGILSADWEPVTPGSQLRVTVQPSRWEAIDVTDRGVIYEVPETHDGQPIPDRGVLTLGRLAADHAELTLQEAQALQKK